MFQCNHIDCNDDGNYISYYQPPKIKKGDTIAVVAPGHMLTPTHISNLNANIERLESMGFKVKLGKYITGYEEPPFSASVKHRLEDLNWALSDCKVKMIIAARGGYGTMELLECVDFKAFFRHPKIVIGYSDLTSLLIPLSLFTEVITYQGPMMGEFWTEKTWNHFEKMFVYNKCKPKDTITYTNDGIVIINDGYCRGQIFAGHFDTLMALNGTKYELCPDDEYILMVEEIDTSLREIDRMMQTLYLSGILKNASGFVYAKSKTQDFTEEELLDILRKHLCKCPNVPAFYGLHFGHFTGNGEHMFLPNGVNGYIKADKKNNMGKISFKVYNKDC